METQSKKINEKQFALRFLLFFDPFFLIQVHSL